MHLLHQLPAVVSVTSLLRAPYRILDSSVNDVVLIDTTQSEVGGVVLVFMD